jgi:pimeloyl-ACP methyl ester carboxylesterase
VPRALANGITIEYETIGSPDAPPVLFVQGFSLQLTDWNVEFLSALADQGFFVLYFDNRDVGLSTWLDGGRHAGADIGEGRVAATYSIPEMAEDTVGLLDSLGIESAHVVGYSMGGMIAQTLAIEYPDRVRTLVSLASTTGSPDVGQMHDEALAVLLTPTPRSRAEAAQRVLAVWRVIGSPDYPLDEEAVRRRAAANYDRAFHPAGLERQFVAMMIQPDRTTSLARVIAPTLVIHGACDVLVDPSGGVATAAAIPGARLMLIPGLGHDIHPDLFATLTRELSNHFRRN